MLLTVAILPGGFKNVFAQTTPHFSQIQSENIRHEKGLSQNTVFSIYQDKQGFIWFGTWDGLNKYDGIRFTIYRPSFLFREGELSDPTVNAIEEDHTGNMWFGTERGLNYYHRKNNTFRHYSSSGEEGSRIVNDTIRHIKRDSWGNLWVAAQNGISIHSRLTAIWHNIRFDSPGSSLQSVKAARNIAFSPDQRAWIATDNGIVVFEKGKPMKQILASDTSKHNDSDFYSLFCYFPNRLSNDFVMIAGSTDAIYLINPNTFEYKIYPLSTYTHGLSSSVTSILCDNDNHIWIGTMGGGLIKFEPDEELFSSYTHNPSDPSSLSDNNILSLMFDRNGSLWAGTWIGVNKREPSRLFFFPYSVSSATKNGLNNNYILAIHQDEAQNLWIGTNGGGVNILNPKTGQHQYLRQGKEIGSDYIRSINRDSSGRYWIGTANMGISIFNPRTKETLSLNDTLSSNQVLCTFQKDNYMWAGTANGLNRIHIFSLEVEKFDLSSIFPDYPNIGKIYHITSDNTGNLWLAAYGGLIRMNLKNNHFTVFRHIEGESNSLSTNRLFCLHFDGIESLFIGTMGGGLNRFNIRDYSVKLYTTENGLPNNVVYGILKDRKNNLWLSTNYGVSEFNPDDETFINYDVQDGLLSHEFNVGASFCDPVTGEMFFGGLNGYIRFLPSLIQQNRIPPPIAITGLKIQNKTWRGELYDNDNVILRHDENFLSIEFAALDMMNPFKNRYRYKLENIDNTWRDTDASRAFADYTDLKPGNYTFRVLASNNDGVWNKDGIRLHLSIKPPWWASWWFRIAAMVIISTLLWYVVYRRIRYFRRKHEIEKHTLELERQALRLQMNPHFIFNSLSSIQSFIVKQSTEDAIAYLSRFARLMRLILNSSRENMVPLKDELDALTLYLELEQLRFDNKFDFSILCDEEIDTEFIAIPPMLIQPYVENAIVHGILHKEGRGRITLSIHKKESTLLCTLEDDGVGREKAAALRSQSGYSHAPKGMLITDQRLQILNESYNEDIYATITDIFDNQGIPCGTRVVLSTPFEEI